MKATVYLTKIDHSRKGTPLVLALPSKHHCIGLEIGSGDSAAHYFFDTPDEAVMLYLALGAMLRMKGEHP